MTLTGALIENVDDLGPWRAQWDELAIQAGRPYAAPAWSLAWWRHVGSRDQAGLRVVLATHDSKLVGIAPFWVDSSGGRLPCFRLMGGTVSSPVEPLARDGFEREAASVFASTLSQAAPAPNIVRLDGVRASGSWAQWLASGWRREPWVHEAFPAPAPGVSIEQLDYDGWLDSKSRSFRQRARRLRRKLEEAGATFRLAGGAELDRDLAAFTRLHHARWEWRGGSDALSSGIERMLHDAGTELVQAGRFRLFSIEVEGQIISSHLLIAAGGEVAYWNGGFDDAWAPYSPSIQTLLHAIRDATERGDRTVDLGPGGQEYKYRLADFEGRRASFTLVPRGRAYPLARLKLMRYQARSVANKRLSPDAKRRIRRVLHRPAATPVRAGAPRRRRSA